MEVGHFVYIMGYLDRRRFLAHVHRSKVFGCAGNAMPAVWANGRVVGAWGQRKDGSVVYWSASQHQATAAAPSTPT